MNANPKCHAILFADGIYFISTLFSFDVNNDNTVYPKKYAHGFCFVVLCCDYTLLFKSNGIFFCNVKKW